MHRLQLHYTLSKDNSPAWVRNALIDLLQAVSQQGSISAAARALGLSYRHVWGELKRWETELAQPLVVWEKGQAAHLTAFGNKLMWAERQTQARFAPQIEALRAELERSFADAFDDNTHVVTIYASHDEALSQLREVAFQNTRQSPRRLHLDIRFMGSVDAIRALNEGRCVLAGFHTLDDSNADLSQRTYKPLLKPGLHKIIGFAQRTQGLMMAPGNPLGLTSLLDLKRTNARFANRALGTGTRVVLDALMSQAQLLPRDIVGFDTHIEPSHAAVAQSVQSGQADAGLGIEAAATQNGLAFVPLATERYHLVCLKSALEQPGMIALFDLLKNQSWQKQINSIAGYRAQNSGQILSMRKVLPWWTYRK
ncbi:MAG TPA: substrate-binding domain-containing protein [Burkholderiaceae bacterium]|nr:substrate-binding domain-containing protein [Burkholderiaceae bacterium]